MLKNLTYPQKTYVLAISFVAFLVVGYRWSFSDTFELAGEIKEKEQKLNWLKDKEKELPALKAKMQEFERCYTAKDSSSVRDKLTAYISDYAEHNNCLVTEIPVNSDYKNERLNIQTNSFTIRGSFADLLQLLHALEKDYQYVSRIMSARFYSTRDPQSKKKTLYLTLIAQSFKQKEKK